MNAKQFNVLLGTLATILLILIVYTAISGSQRLRTAGVKKEGVGATVVASITPSSQKPKALIFTDKAGLYSVALPKQWEVTADEGTKGVQLSFMTAESLDYRERRDETADGPFTPIYYEAGAKLRIHVTKGEQELTNYGERGGPDTGVILAKHITVDGVGGLYHAFKEPSTQEGQLLNVHLNYQGNNYILTLMYNSLTRPEGEKIFSDILNSFKFSK
ncbi:MAG: hypothetical protein M3416_00155 [Acidobacteriota bacterium]|nr:hypothetical protein [Acidobacteriota bacterium]